jgi:hypothetical protein
MVADLTNFCSPESGAVVVDEVDVLGASVDPAVMEPPADARGTWEGEGGAVS